MTILFKYKKLFLCISLMTHGALVIGSDNDAHKAWTWTYKKHIDTTSLGTRYACKVGVPKCTQLILSWDGKRPSKGYFTFWGQFRDAQTQQWLTKHQLMVWGAHVQRSFASLKAVDSANHYVRLEMPLGSFADAVMIEVQAHDGASLSTLKQLFLNVSNLSAFTPEEDSPPLQTVRINNVPRYSQMTLQHSRAMHMCSPTAMTMLVECCLRKKLDPLTFSLNVYDGGLDTYGSWPFNVAYANEISDSWYFYVTRLSSFKELYRLLERNIPVVVSVRGPLQGSAAPYASGHLVVVTGYDAINKKVLCNDPAFPEDSAVTVHYDYHDFIRAWEKSRRLAYKAERRGRQ